MQKFKIILWMLPVVFSGCAHTAHTRTGFVDNYAKMEVFEFKGDFMEDSGAMIFVQKGVDWGGYRNVHVEPVVYRPVKIDGSITAKDQNEITEKLETSLREAFGKDRALAGTNGMHTLRIRAAVTDMETADPAVNIAATVILFSPIIMGGSSVEIEVQDGWTHEPLASMTAYNNGNILQMIDACFRLGQAKTACEKWANRLHDRLGKERNFGF